MVSPGSGGRWNDGVPEGPLAARGIEWCDNQGCENAPKVPPGGFSARSRGSGAVGGGSATSGRLAGAEGRLRGKIGGGRDGIFHGRFASMAPVI